jgi:hypothetical protein
MMNTPHVTLDEQTAKELAKAGRQPVALCDPAGAVIGYYVTQYYASRIEEERRELREMLDRDYPPEVIAKLEEQRRNDPRPDIPHEEVIRWVEGQK